MTKGGKMCDLTKRGFVWLVPSARKRVSSAKRGKLSHLGQAISLILLATAPVLVTNCQARPKQHPFGILSKVAL